MDGGGGGFEDFLRRTTLRSLFRKKRKNSGDDDEFTGNRIPQLSRIANTVVARCSKILSIPLDELQNKFEEELPDHLQKPPVYARNLLECCCYQALHVLTKDPNYLMQKEFRRFTFDMLLAWEAPGSEFRSKENVCDNSLKTDEEDDAALFYTDTTNLAVQVDQKKTVGAEAFSRIAPACPAVADPITVHNLFDALTSSCGGQLHFLIYDKYIGSLDKVYRSIKNLPVPSLVSGLQLSKGEIILDIDGTLPTLPVFQHIGISAWPGRLTLTNQALYFEKLGVGSYDKAAKYDLAADLKQVIKPELTGPLGARIFDKAVLYKSNLQEEPVCFEFPEFKGHSRRDYWLDVILEIAYANRFIRKFNLKDIKRVEALSKAITGIIRFRAVKEAFHVMPSRFRTLLSFKLAEELPKGDEILDALYIHLEGLYTCSAGSGIHNRSLDTNLQAGCLPVSLQTLTTLGLSLLKETDVIKERDFLISDLFIGDSSPLEMAVKKLLCHTGAAEAAWATVEQVKVDGIDTNVAVMQELLFPIIELHKQLRFLAVWEDPFKSTVFLIFVLYLVHRGWVRYLLPCTFSFLAVLMLWNKHHNKGIPLEAFRITLPPSRNPVEQLLSLQEAISQFEAVIQAGNIILLKIRAILLGALPQATDKVAISLIAAAIAVSVVPFKFFMILAFVETFTREMPLRKNLSDKFERRTREWWIHIPAAPVQLIRVDEAKKSK